MNLSGQWHSRYIYPGSHHDQPLESTHTVVFEHAGTTLTGHSLEDPSGSRLALNLTLDQNVATGTWQEHTSPTGHYRGAVFHGAIQLIISPDGRSMSGVWVGFNSRYSHINHGQWDFTR